MNNKAPDCSHRLVIHQPNFNPYLGVVAKYLLAQTVVHLDTVQFVKNEFQNRNRILVNGKPHWLTVPVHQQLGQPIREVKINQQSQWQTKHLRTLEQNYRQCDYFEMVYGSVRNLYNHSWENLLDWNTAFLRWLWDYLKIDCPVFLASELPAVSNERDQRLVDYCQQLGFTRYLAGRGGLEYMQPQVWNEASIQVQFLQYNHPTYPQSPAKDFVPMCGVLDLLFRVSPEEARRIILSGVELVSWENK